MQIRIPAQATLAVLLLPALAQAQGNFDAISNPQPGPGEAKVWRIDRPEVRRSLTEYPSIRFEPGDVLTVEAGGCVQTGGSGLTWKRYVNPLGDDAAALYSGIFWVPGVVGGQTNRIAGVLNRNWQVPQNLPAPVASQLYLRLGYQDQQGKYGDNGYYSHDNGNSDQCKNVGAAWVEIHVRKAPAPPVTSGPVWSPHSRPFDLVWDERVGVDANGLPLNPIWAQQIASPGSKPSFTGTCGGALSGGDTINYGALAATCTSQSPSVDLTTTIIPFLCPGDPLRGHVNWSVATFIGPIAWSEWSGNFFVEDDDFNLALSPPNNGALTSTGDGLGLEFNASESIDAFTNPWWAGIRNAAENGHDPVAHAQIDGKLAVVTGLFGLDCVHDCNSESHPVYALAIRASEGTSGGTVEETWNFFMRNSGNEGNCSKFWHDWAGIGGIYYIQLPWPEGASGVNLAASDVNASPFGGSQNGNGMQLQQEPGWTYLVFHLPDPSAQAGVDGQVTLRYTLASNPANTSIRNLNLSSRVVTRAHPEDGYGEDALLSHIADPSAKTRFNQINHSTASAWRANFPGHTQKLSLSPAIAPHPRLAAQGALRRDVIRADPARQAAVTGADQKIITGTPINVNAMRAAEPKASSH